MTTLVVLVLLYSYPRSSAHKPIDTGTSQKYGVYLLLSANKVYVGQSRDLAQRINQHIKGKDWWERAVILTTADNHFTKSDIDYLEYVLIQKAFKNGTLDCDNKREEKEPKTNKSDRLSLGQYLEEALFLLKLLDITVFAESGKTPFPNTPKTQKTVQTPKICEKELQAALFEGKGKKPEAMQYLSHKGIAVSKHTTYAVRQKNYNEFWANPTPAHLSLDWYVLLNDNK